MRKALITLFSVGLLGALLVPSCVIKEKASDGDNKGGASSEAGGSNSLFVGGSASTSGGEGGVGGVAAASTVAACKDLKIVSDTGESCSSTSMSATYNSIHMLIVLDKSGSMTKTPDGFGVTKWDAMQTSLAAALKASGEQVRYGLLMYPYVTTGDATFCELPTGADAINVDVALAKTSVPLITKALEATTPSGGTPTAAALAAALEYYTNGMGKTLEGDKYVLLATDGGPNCNAEITACDTASCTFDLDKQNGVCGALEDGTTFECCVEGNTDLGTMGCVDSEGVTAQIEALKTAGIKTFVVGIPGTENYQTYLDQFAVAGGVTDPNNADHKYYEVSAADGVAGLTSTFKSITESLVRDCDVKLAEAPVNPKKLNVAIECKLLAQGEATLADADKNWVYNGNAKNPIITIQGDMCDVIEKEGVTRVDVIEGCTTVIME